MQKQLPRGVLQKGVLKNFGKFLRKYLRQSLFFNKVTDLKFANLLKRSFWLRVSRFSFPMVRIFNVLQQKKYLVTPDLFMGAWVGWTENVILTSYVLNNYISHQANENGLAYKAFYYYFHVIHLGSLFALLFKKI